MEEAEGKKNRFYFNILNINEFIFNIYIFGKYFIEKDFDIF